MVAAINPTENLTVEAYRKGAKGKAAVVPEGVFGGEFGQPGSPSGTK